MLSFTSLRAARRSTPPDPRLRAVPAFAAAGTPVPTGELRTSDRSFFARVKRWLGLGTAETAEPASLLARLRPPSTGRISFFFGRLSRLSAQQMTLARAQHQALQGAGAQRAHPPAAALPLPAALQSCLREQARRKPEDLFDAVCALWAGAGSPQAAAWPQQAQAFLRDGGSPDVTLMALRQALLQAWPGQGAAQADARAQAAYAALVGAVSHHAAGRVAGPAPAIADPFDDLGRRLDVLAALPATPQTLRARVEALAGIQVGLDAAAPPAADAATGDAQAARRAELVARCGQLQSAQQAEVGRYLGERRDALRSRALEDASARLEAERSALDTLRAAMAAFRSWPQAGVRAACEAQATGLQEDLDAVAASAGILARYEAIQEPAPGPGATASRPCAPLADFLRRGTVANYRSVQDAIDRFCALAEPADHVDLLATLGAGILSDKGEVRAALIDDLLAGKPEAVNGLLRGAQWDALAGAVRQAAVDRREQAALAEAADAPSRAAVAAEYRKQRFATDLLHRRRELNTEINRLVALRDPTQRADLLGDAGAMPGASEAAIAQIRAVAGDLGRQVDVLLVNWIYCSCLDPATLDIDVPRVRALWQCLKGGDSPLPGLEDAQVLLEQGFRSFHALGDVHQRIEAFSRLLADAQVLAAASHAHDPLVLAQGMVTELHARVTGQEGVDPADPAFAGLLRQRVEAARQDWIAAGGLPAAKLLDAVARRDALLARLQGQGWKFDLGPDGHLRSTIAGSSVSQHEQLRRLVQCLGVVDFIREEASQPASGSRARAADLAARDFQPLAAQLRHFDPVDKRLRPAQGDAPELGQMMRLLDHQDDLDALLKASDDVARLSAHFSQPPASTAALEEVVEAGARIAALQEAIANGSGDFRAPAQDGAGLPVDGVLRRLQAFGLGLADPIPRVSRMVGDVGPQLQRQALDMASLCKRLDPVSPSAAGVVQARIPGAPAFAAGAKGLLARARAHVAAGEARRRLDNQHAIAQRFAGLQAGQAFDIQLGRSGEIAIGTPVVPGLTVSLGLQATQASGIRISRTGAQSFQVDVVRARSGAVSATLAALAGAVAGTGRHSAEARQGYRITCTSRQQAAELVEALVGVRRLDAARWTGGQVQELGSSARESRASIQAKFELPSPSESPLLTLEAELDAASGRMLEVTQSPFLRVERRTQARAWQARAAVDVLEGRLAGEAERGAQVSETRTCVRRGALLRGEPTLTLQSRVVAGDAKACLLRVMPQLAGEALAHYVAQVEQVQAAARDAGQTVGVEIESVMTAEGVRRANHFYRQAAALLQAPGQDPALARAKAQAALQEAEREMREPSNYEMRGMAVVLESAAEEAASEELPLKETARVGGTTRQALTPWAGQSWKLLP